MTDDEAKVLALSKELQIHVDCINAKACQETEGLKGTEHEGVDVCKDGCVWYDPRTKLKNKLDKL